jgi:arginyl-tRNA--protein-N-Asp/Glu arginylyltransferase
MTDNFASLRFFLTTPHACSYLPDQEARTVFLDPLQSPTMGLYSQLATAGFRRSGTHLYRPDCLNCQACISCRVRVGDFSRSSRFEKIWRRNNDLSSRPLESLEDPSVYALYCRYINKRHQNGDMYPPDRQQFHAFLETKTDSTQFFGFYLHEQLLAVSVIDELDHGLSAMYTFYDPDFNKRSLGNFIILWQIEKARKLKLPYLYLGYWIKSSTKMHYKTQYRPIELYVANKWRLLT